MDRVFVVASVIVLSWTSVASAASPDPVVADRPCVITLSGGERFTGTVVQLDSGRRLHLKGEVFQGEVVIPVEKITSMCYGEVPATAAPGEVILADGGRICGKVVGIAADAVALDCAAGRIKVPRRVIRAVNFAPVAEVLVGSDFAGGKFDPWKNRYGATSWAFADGMVNFKIACAVGPAVTATVDTNESFTVEAKVRPTPNGRRIGLEVRDNGGTTLGLISFTANGASFTLSSTGVGAARNASGQLDPKRLNAKGVILRLVNDTKKGMASFWLDGIQLGECTARPPASGTKTVGVDLGGLASIEYARVLKGAVSPNGLVVADTVPASGAHIDFANGDRVVASSVALDDGRITFDVGAVQATCNPGHVARVVFAAPPTAPAAPSPAGAPAGAAAAPAPARDLVEGDFGRLSLRLVRMTPDELVGQSDDLGEIRLRPAGLRQVTFAQPRGE
jgi:hypothetical protein